MSWLFSPSPEVGLPIVDSDLRFPVRRVFCVGQNYAEHAREMGSDGRQPPFFFCKAREAITHAEPFHYPSLSEDVQFEIELVAALGSGGRDLAAESALECVWGYGVGLDMTRRDLQGAAKKSGRPWEAGKAFDGSAPCSALISADTLGHPDRGRIWLDVNGEKRQRGDLDQMIWKLPEILAELSQLFTLAAGDLIFTGTPSGVGPINIGDRITGGVDGVADIDIEVVR